MVTSVVFRPCHGGGGDLTVSQTHVERTDWLTVGEGAGLGERLVLTITAPQFVWLVAGLVILEPLTRTLSSTGLAHTQTDPATVLAATSLVLSGPAAASGLHIVAVTLWAGQSPLVVADLSLLDCVVSTFPNI